MLLLKIKFNESVINDKLKLGFLEATDMADYLVKKGESFRKAHHIIGNIVKYCIENSKTIPDLSINELKNSRLITSKYMVSHADTRDARLKGEIFSNISTRFTSSS